MNSIQALFIAVLCVALSVHKAAADTPNPGFKSLFIGHSFFAPIADGLPNYVASAGIAGHSQLVVRDGGDNGQPLALWNNPTKSAEIKAYLDSGDVDGDRIGDSIDNCISIANPDQEPSSVNPSCGAACETASCAGVTCANH